jgi:preprotein translocase SecE subunit
MASVTKANEENRAGSPDKGDGNPLVPVTPPTGGAEADDVRALDKARQTEPRSAGLFTIYKKGQGYWTRMGTLIGAGVVIVMLAYTLYVQIPASFFGPPNVSNLEADVSKLQEELAASDRQPVPALKLPAAQVEAKQSAIRGRQAEIAQMRADRVTLGQRVGLAVSAGFLIAAGAVSLWLMNKPGNVDFLIATDSEMKKVNWTSRKELIGSSKVVILFMFLIASYLFLNDLVWGYLMWAINVLKTPPLG